MSRLVCPAIPDLDIPALYVHDLTGTASAERLLSKPPPTHPSSGLVHRRLRSWAPELAAFFTPLKNRIKDVPFRLITRHPTWVDEVVPGFVAVSYCWHSDEWQLAPPLRHDGSTKGIPLPISELMLSGLVRHLPTPDTAIWIDQLCIEQSNPTEKKHAIEQMDTIFRNAHKTIILLEDLVLEETSHNALLALGLGKLDPRGLQADQLAQDSQNRCPIVDLTKLDDKSADRIEGGFNSDTSGLVEFIGILFRSRWFTRAWCRHELLLSIDSILIFHGSGQGLVSIHSTFPLFLTKLTRHLTDKRLWSSITDQRQFDHIRVLQHHERRVSRSSVESPFPIFCDLRSLSCSIAADKIAIAMNLVGLQFGLDMNITSTRFTVEYVLSTLALAMGDAAALGSGFSHLRSQDIQSRYFVWHMQRGIPGSATNWQEHRGSIYSMWFASSISDNHRLESVGDQSAVLGLLLLRSQPYQIPCKYTYQVFQYLKALASIDFTFGVGTTFNLEYLESLIKDHQDHLGGTCDRYTDIPLQFLCISLIAMLGKQLPSAVSEGLDYQSALDVTDWDRAATSALIFWLHETEDSLAPHHLHEHMGRFICFCFNLSAYLPYTPSNTQDWNVIALRVGSGAADIALLAIPKDIDFSIFDSPTDVSIAIPTALNTSDCVKLQRVWLLRDTNDGPVKSCFAKGYLFGRGRIEESDGYVDYLDGVEVVGPPLTDTTTTATAGVDIQTALYDPNVSSSSN